MISEPASQLAAALRKRLAIVADEESRRRPEQHFERLKNISTRIEDLAARLPKPLDPQLAHFLQRASYSKALEWLEQSAPPSTGSPQGP